MPTKHQYVETPIPIRHVVRRPKFKAVEKGRKDGAKAHLHSSAVQGEAVGAAYGAVDGAL
jgi:hypothetical protein